MAVTHRIIEWLQYQRKPITTLDLTVPKQAVAAEEVAPQLFTLTTGDSEDPGFRRITSPQTLRDLNPVMHDRMLQVCYFLKITTPFGKRIVEIITDYVVGKGVRVAAKDRNVQAVIDRFWNDEVNRMDSTLREWCDELTTFGELCVPVAVNPVDGLVRIGYIDPMNIDSIQYSEMQSVNATIGISVPYAVRVRRMVGEANPAVMQIVRTVEDPNDERFGRKAGACFYAAINKAKSASRGFSELFSLADWIDVFDQMIFDFADKVRFLNSFIWHYIIEGGNEKQVSEYKDRLTKQPPRQGGVQVTNERVKIEAQTPDFKGADMERGAHMVKLYGLGGAGLPAWFFGDGDTTNRSTAEEMAGPTGKKVMSRQNHLGEFLRGVLDFQIDQAILAGVLPENIDRTLTIEFPELAVKDLAKGASTLQGVTASLSMGVEEGWITSETAARAFHNVMAEIGTDIDDSRAEFEAAQKEKQQQQEKARQQQDALFPQGNLAAALAAQQQPPQPPEAGDEGMVQ